MRIVKRIAVAIIVVLCAACRGEPVPRDYQNAPPAVTHPADDKSQAPSAHGMGQATPETGTGGSGTAAPEQPVNPTDVPPADTTMPDTPPTTTAVTTTT